MRLSRSGPVRMRTSAKYTCATSMPAVLIRCLARRFSRQSPRMRHVVPSGAVQVRSLIRLGHMTSSFICAVRPLMRAGSAEPIALHPHVTGTYQEPGWSRGRALADPVSAVISAHSIDLLRSYADEISNRNRSRPAGRNAVSQVSPQSAKATVADPATGLFPAIWTRNVVS